MTMKSVTIDSKLLDAKMAIENSLNSPDILDLLDDFGYTEARIEKGKGLYKIGRASCRERV